MWEIELLQKQWRDRERNKGVLASMRLDKDALVLGAGTVLAKRRNDGALALGGEDAKLLTLLSVAHGRPVGASALRSMRRASQSAETGDDARASMHIALALPTLRDPADAARRLFFADGLLKEGVAPRDIWRALEFDPAPLDEVEKYNPDEPRNPKGDGKASGEWTVNWGDTSIVDPDDFKNIPADVAPRTGTGRRESEMVAPDEILHQTLQPTGPIPGYPETGRDVWRAANDLIFQIAVASYNSKYDLSPGDPGYWTPFRLKAQAMVESGGDRAAFESDPLQVNKPGDATDDKRLATGLVPGQIMTPLLSAQSALEWLRHKGLLHGTGGRVVSWKGNEAALRDYNGKGTIDSDTRLPRKIVYARRVLALTHDAEALHARTRTLDDRNHRFDEGE